MRVHFIWPSSTLNPSTSHWDSPARDLFWLSATPEEAKEKLFPRMKPEELKHAEEVFAEPTTFEDSFLCGGKVYFLIADPLSSAPCLHLWMRVYPYSGMWNGSRPFIAIGPPGDDLFREPEGIEIDPDLLDKGLLYELGRGLRNGWHLAPPPKRGWMFPLENFDRSKIPQSHDKAAFGFKRKFHRHEGIDLHAADGTLVYAVEDGTVVAVLPFTGPQVGSPWWFDTQCVMVEGQSGVVNYGEVTPAAEAIVGMPVREGQLVGLVQRVLREDDGRPASMLHLELYQHGTREPVEWPVDQAKQPEGLLDPTKLLLEAKPHPRD